MSTLAQLRTEVSSILGLDNTASSAEQSLMDSWINEGVANVLVETHCKVLPFTMTLTAGEDDYTLSTDILALIDLFVDAASGDDFPVQRVTSSELLRMRMNASTAISPVMRYATSGSNLLMVYPTPSAADVLVGIYVPRPTTLSSASDTPSEVPAEYHRLIVQYACWRGADMDDDSSSEQGERYRGLYELGCGELRQAVKGKGGSRLAPARHNPRRRQLIPHNNSTDY